jgi:hypothetical protein
MYPNKKERNQLTQSAGTNQPLSAILAPSRSTVGLGRGDVLRRRVAESNREQNKRFTLKTIFCCQTNPIQPRLQCVPGLFPGSHALGRGADNPTYLAPPPRLRTGYSYTSTPSLCVTACYSVNFTFHSQCETKHFHVCIKLLSNVPSLCQG